MDLEEEYFLYLHELKLDELSNDVLLEIFSNLDAATLVSASKVCTRWFALISQSTSLMRKLELSVFLSSSILATYGGVFQGKHENLFMRSYCHQTRMPAKFSSFLDRYSKIAKNVTLQDFNQPNLVETLAKLPGLRKLKIHHISEYADVGDFEKIDLPSLECLEFRCSAALAKFIDATHLRVLKISSDLKSSASDVRAITAVLKEAVNLKELTLSNLQKPLTFPSDEINFALSDLTIENLEIDSGNFQEFLAMQASSLRRLGLNVSNVSFDVIAKVLYEMQVTELEITAKALPVGIEFIKKRNSSIKQLTMMSSDHRFDPNHSELTGKFILLCRNLESLALYSVNADDILPALYKSDLNVMTLRLDRVPRNNPALEFMNLYHLEIDLVCTTEHARQEDFLDFTLFVIRSPNLLTVRVNRCSAFNESYFTNMLLKSAELEEITIGAVCSFSCDSLKTILYQMSIRPRIRKISFLKFNVVAEKEDSAANHYMNKYRQTLFESSHRSFKPSLGRCSLGMMDREYVCKMDSIDAYNSDFKLHTKRYSKLRSN